MSDLPAALAFLAQKDPGSWVEIVLVLIFLLVGMIRSIARAVKGEDKPGGAPKRVPRQRTPSGEGAGRSERSGLDRWAELLRGEEPKAEVRPVARPKRRASASPPVVATRPELIPLPPGTEAREPMVVPELVHLPSEDREVVEEERLEERQSEIEEPAPLLAEPSDLGAPRAPRPADFDRTKLAQGWRHAIITAELLGRPVALRGREGGPVGLRD